MKKILLIIILLLNFKAFSCTCVHVSVKKGYDYSSCIFYGKFLGTDISSNFYNLTGQHIIFDNFEVNYFIKGIDSSTFNFSKKLLKNKKYIISILSSSSESCGITFEKNKMYLVYTFNEFSTFWPTTNGCTRTRIIEDNNFQITSDYDEEKGKNEIVELIKYRNLDSNYSSYNDRIFNITTENKILKNQINESINDLKLVKYCAIFLSIAVLILVIVLFYKIRKKTIVTILLFLIFTTSHAQNKIYENLVFEGGGVRGIAYAGVIKQLEDANILQNIKNVGGTSAGAITALMVSLGYSSQEIYKIIPETKFEKFNDGEYIFVGGIARLNKNYGWYKGGEFNKWLEKIIKNKTNNANITFEEMATKGFKNLYVTATCMNKQKLIVFSAQTYPKMKIKDAVRISMSIPLYFEAVFIDSLGQVYNKPQNHKNLDIVVDGGIIGNFPIFMFDSTYTDLQNNKKRIPNYKTIGVRIDTDQQIINDSLNKELVPVEIKKLEHFMEAFYNLVIENLNRNTLIPEDWERTISISSAGISPKIKRLSVAQKEKLVESGANFTKKFLVKNGY